MAEKREWESQNMRLRMVRELQGFLRDAAKDAATLVVGGYDELDYANLLDAHEAASKALLIIGRLPRGR